MRIATTAMVLALVTTTAAAQSMPNANPTAMPSANGTMPNANQTPEATRNTNLPRADGTIAPLPSTSARVPYSGALCQPGAMTGRCNPIPNPSCLPGQAVTASGQRCPTPMVP